ncbi:putative LRR receptor-like serine/threonine-protein kinase [Arachis hypogaea]|nr:putative LRR receptor-like serine/threonine-protein kinase [Arachis hypogaea]
MPLAFLNLQNFACGGNLFTSIFPSSISNLSELQKFDIEENGFYGLISRTLGSLHKLREFKVGRNRFGTGRAHNLNFLSSLTNCTQLQMLDFYENYLGDALTNLIGNLSTNLILLDMGLNQISRRIPEKIGNLFGLGSLLMDENALEGPIPNSIGKLKNLVIIFLSMNNLSGNFSTGIGNLTILSEVHMDFNAFEGSIPFTLRYYKKMHTFSILVNNLSENIPTQTFGYQEGLVNLDLFTNSFTGSIPIELGNLMHLFPNYICMQTSFVVSFLWNLVHVLH